VHSAGAMTSLSNTWRARGRPLAALALAAVAAVQACDSPAPDLLDAGADGGSAPDGGRRDAGVVGDRDGASPLDIPDAAGDGSFGRDGSAIPRDGGDGAIARDGGPPVVGGTHATIAGGLEPDLSCLGTRTAPTAGTEVDTTLRFVEAVSVGALPAGATIDVFPGDSIVDGCTPPACVRAIADGSGAIDVALGADGWFAYRVREGGAASSEPFTTLGYHRRRIPMLYSRSRVPGAALVFGTLSDCGGAAIGNAVVRVFQGATEIVAGVGASDPFAGYFSGSSPCPSRCRATDPGTIAAPSDGARFVVGNIVPASDAPLRIEAHATLGGGALTRIACEEIAAVGEAIALIDLGPSRADYPPGSSCL
jgi:hypothetical protein